MVVSFRPYILVALGFFGVISEVIAAPGQLYSNLPTPQCSGDVERFLDNSGKTTGILCGDTANRVTRLYSATRDPITLQPVQIWQTQPGATRQGYRVMQYIQSSYARFVVDCTDETANGANGLLRVMQETSGTVVASLNTGMSCKLLASIDITGDAVDDIVVASDSQLKAYRFQYGSITEAFTGSFPSYYGPIQSITKLGQNTPDYYTDWAIGFPFADLGGVTDRGLVLLFWGSAYTGQYTQIWGAAASNRLGASLGRVPSLNSNGSSELLIGIPGRSELRIYDNLSATTIRTLTRIQGDGLGSRVDGFADVNGDNVGDILVGHLTGTTLFSGKNGAILLESAAQSESLILGPVSAHDPDLIYGSLLLGGNAMYEGNNYGCPSTIPTQFSNVGVWCDGGFEPIVSMPKGCFVEGGQGKFVISNISPLKPYSLAISTSQAGAPLTLDGINTLVVSRRQIETVLSGVAIATIPSQPNLAGSGRGQNIVRDLQITDRQGDGIVEWYLQAFQYDQTSGHPQGAGMCSSDGVVAGGLLM